MLWQLCSRGWQSCKSIFLTWVILMPWPQISKCGHALEARSLQVMLRAAELTHVSTNRWTLWSRPLSADSLWQTDHRLHLRLTLGSGGRLPVPWGRCCVSSGSPLMRGTTLIFGMIMLTLHCRSDETAGSPWAWGPNFRTLGTAAASLEAPPLVRQALRCGSASCPHHPLYVASSSENGLLSCFF